MGTCDLSGEATDANQMKKLIKSPKTTPKLDILPVENLGLLVGKELAMTQHWHPEPPCVLG